MSTSPRSYTILSGAIDDIDTREISKFVIFFTKFLLIVDFDIDETCIGLLGIPWLRHKYFFYWKFIVFKELQRDYVKCFDFGGLWWRCIIGWLHSSKDGKFTEKVIISLV